MEQNMKLKSVSIYIIFVFALLFLFEQFSSSTTLVSPADSKINYYGRVDFSTPATPRYGWSGVIIEANFTGTTIGMKIEHPDAYYIIEIDGKLDTVVNIKTAGEYIFSKKLTENNHAVRIKLRSEDHYTVGTFQGLLLADGQHLNDPPSKPLRKIEFIGDSFTAGYGIESPGVQCTQDEVKKYTNVFKGFTTNVTEAFHAQNVILGWSGAGMVRNYGYDKKRSDDPFPFYYDRLYGNANDQKKWNFSQWVPDLVVICLGTNDYSTTPHPDDSMYLGDYHKLINRILTNYSSDVPVLCVSTGDATFEKNVKKIVSEQKSVYSHSKVFFAPYPTGLSYDVCHSHPSMSDNGKIAKALIDTIMNTTGWDTTNAITSIPFQKSRIIPEPYRFRVSQTSDMLFIATNPEAKGTINLITLNGKKFGQLRIDDKGIYSIPKSSLQGESILIGNAQYGYQKIITIN
jgi:lysophospholipase L1-like esterase